MLFASVLLLAVCSKKKKRKENDEIFFIFVHSIHYFVKKGKEEKKGFFNSSWILKLVLLKYEPRKQAQFCRKIVKNKKKYNYYEMRRLKIIIGGMVSWHSFDKKEKEREKEIKFWEVHIISQLRSLLNGGFQLKGEWTIYLQNFWNSK